MEWKVLDGAIVSETLLDYGGFVVCEIKDPALLTQIVDDHNSHASLTAALDACLEICKEIADDPHVNLVSSERRLKLYCAIVKADPTWPGGNDTAFNEAKKARGE